VIEFYFAASHAFRLIGAIRISLLYLGGGIWALSTQKGNPLFAHVPINSPKLILRVTLCYATRIHKRILVYGRFFYAVDAAQLMAAQNAKDAKRATKQKREEFRTSAHLSKGCALITSSL
jgi:hypothetical protein